MLINFTASLSDTNYLLQILQIVFLLERHQSIFSISIVTGLVLHRLLENMIYEVKNSKKSVSYQKKNGRGHARPPFFWYDNSKDLKVCFLVMHIK